MHQSIFISQLQFMMWIFQSVFTNARDKLMKEWEENDEPEETTEAVYDDDSNSGAFGYVRNFYTNNHQN